MRFLFMFDKRLANYLRNLAFIGVGLTAWEQKQFNYA